MKKNNPKKNNITKPKTAWHTFGQWCLWIYTFICITGLLVACFGGNFNPTNVQGLSLMILALPIWAVLWLSSLIFDFLWCRKALPFCILAFIASADALWQYCPLNIIPPSQKNYIHCPKFTLLTYNVASFNDIKNNNTLPYNPTVSYIIKTNADIVCLQETEVPLTGPFDRFKILSEQIDSINQLYPYRLLYGGFLTVLSKYPVEAIHTPPLANDPKQKWRSYPIGVFRINIDGLPLTLFNVHLQSYGLNKADKQIYKNIAEGKDFAEVSEGSIRKNLSEIKSHLIYKVQDAAEKRAQESDYLCRYIEKFGGPNVIVAGDFNDVAGCYTIKRLEGFDLKQVYPQIGFGPMISFNADLFYFRIDHVLYKGALKPLKIKRGNIKCSDHYPIIVDFAVTENRTEQIN